MNAHDSSAEQVTAEDAESLVMPAMTAAPMVLALGMTLAAMGVVTSWVLSGAGLVLIVGALVSWVRQLLPGRGEYEHALVHPELRPRPISAAEIGVEEHPPKLMQRLQVPAEIHPYSSGLIGGLVGGVAMSLVAGAYGLVSSRGLWYPVNLLAAMLMPGFATASDAELEQFNLNALLLGLLIHVVISAGAGLFYGVLLPTLPRWPVLWGGIVAPLLWTGAIHSSMGVLNPVMNSRVDWPWFVVSQIVFGLTTGLVIVRSKLVPATEKHDGIAEKAARKR